jgi:hypothetical protein
VTPDHDDDDECELRGHIEVASDDDGERYVYVHLEEFPGALIDSDNARTLAHGLREIADLLCYHATDIDIRAGRAVPS